MAMDVMSGYYFHAAWVSPSFWWQRFWWSSIDGVIITIPWSTYSKSSIMPDHDLKNWLETHVGRKGWDWDWRLSLNPADFREIRFGLIDIKFRKSKADLATLTLLKWSK